MADYNTITTYAGNGTVTDFAIPFNYLNKADVVVSRQNGSVSYTFLNPNLIRLSAPLAVGDVLTIQRVTDLDPAAVTFNNGSVVTAGQLNAGFNQSLFAAQEANDKVSRGLFADTFNRLNAGGRRIINLAAPVDPTDAVTKEYADAVPAEAAASASAAAASAASASASAANASASASAAAASAASAAMALDNFDDRYLGQKTSDPALDNDGNALLTGALYFNTTNRVMRVYDGAVWIDASSALPATLATYVYVASAGQTVFSGADANNNTMSFVAPFLIVSLNGLELRPNTDYSTGANSITLVTAASAGDKIQVQAFKPFEVANIQAQNVTFQQPVAGAATLTVESKLRQGNFINAADFVGFDATGATPSTTAIQNALNLAASLRCDVYLPTGARTGALTIPSGVFLVGPSAKAFLLAAAGNYATITLSGSDCGVRNLFIDETSKTGGATFLLACGTTGKDRVTIENVVTLSSWQLFADSGTGNGVHTTTKIRDVQAKAHRGPGVVMTRGFAFIEFDHVIIDYVGVSASNFTGFSFSGAGLPAGAGGLILERCDVLGTAGVFTNTSQVGYVFADMAAVRLHNTRADTCGSDGFVFTNVNGVIMDDVTAGLCDGHAMTFTGCTSVVANKVFLFGRNYLSSPAANKDGLRFVSGNVGCLFGSVLVRDCTGNGVHKVAEQTGAINITGLSAFANTGRGVKTVGNSGFVVTGFQFGGNTAGNYDLGGSFDFLLSGQFASGGAGNAGPGPATG